jgi:hypothetical protein
MLSYTWKPRKTLINDGTKVTIRDLNQNVVTPPQTPTIANGSVTVYVEKEGRYFVSITSQGATTTHRVDINDTQNDVRPVTSLAEVQAEVKSAFASHTLAQRLDPRPRAIIFGTSLERQHGLLTDSDVVIGQFVERSGWANWANAYLEQRFSFTQNAGVSGNRFDQMLVRLSSDVLAHPSEWVWIGGPVNDISGGRSASAIIADITEIHKRILASGRRIHQLSAAPSDHYDTADKKSVLDEVNAHIWTLDNTPGVTVSDAFTALRSGTGAYGPAAHTVVDGIHWNDQGAHIVGYLAAQRIAAALPPLPRGLQSEIGQKNYWRGAFDAAPNSSVVAGTTVSLSSGKILYKATSMADGDTPGAGWEFNISSGRYAAGDKLQFEARIKWWDIEAKTGLVRSFWPGIKLQFRNVDSTFSTEASSMSGASARDRALVFWKDSGEVVLRTQIATVPVTNNRIYPRIDFNGVKNGYFEVSDLRIIKLN